MSSNCIYGETDTPFEIYKFAQKTENNTGYDYLLEEIDELIAKYPDRAESYVLKGRLLENVSDIKQALINYEKALKCNPDNAAYYAILGRKYQQQGRFYESIETFTDMIENKDLKNYSYYASRNGGLRLISACCVGDWEIAIEDIAYIDDDFVYYTKPIDGRITKERLEKCINEKKMLEIAAHSL